MVRSDVEIGSRSTQTVYTIEANRSLSWRQSKWLFLVLSGCLLLVSLYFASLGAWLVLPFTGLEILIVGIAIYCQSCCAHRKQYVRIGRNRVEIGDSRHSVPPACFPRAWSQIVQIRDRKGWYPSRLLVGSHGKFVEVGKGLMEDERNSLAHQLRCAIGSA